MYCMYCIYQNSSLFPPMILSSSGAEVFVRCTMLMCVNGADVRMQGADVCERRQVLVGSLMP